MSEETAKTVKRPVEQHFLPKGYKGRCLEGAFISQFVSYGRAPSDAAPDATLHKFEMRLPVPTSDEEAKALYGFSLDEIIRKGVERIGNDIDGQFKGVIFDGIESWHASGDVGAKAHAKAQDTIDSWRYDPTTAKGKGSGTKVEVSALVGQLVSAGVLSADEAEGITTNADLSRVLATKNIG